VSRRFTITLESNDLGQVRDGLEARASSWEATARYLLTGELGDGVVIEECSHADEALRIASHYRSILAMIDSQVASQGGW